MKKRNIVVGEVVRKKMRVESKRKKGRTEGPRGTKRLRTAAMGS
jgi:hypothetical protein